MNVLRAVKFSILGLVCAVAINSGSAQAQCGVNRYSAGYGGYGGYSSYINNGYGFGGYSSYRPYVPAVPYTSYYAPSYGGVNFSYHPGTFVPHRNHYHYVPGHVHRGW
jgi:hypothetical protein